MCMQQSRCHKKWGPYKMRTLVSYFPGLEYGNPIFLDPSPNLPASMWDPC